MLLDIKIIFKLKGIKICGGFLRLNCLSNYLMKEF